MAAGTLIDMETYPRRAHFEYFRAMRQPYVGITADVDITRLRDWIKRERLPFFLTTLYAAVQAANRVPELRQRIAGEGILQYDWCNPSYTVALPDGSFCYCRVDAQLELREFLERAAQTQREAMENPSIEDGDAADSLLFVSSLPWLRYSSLIQPTPEPADSNPRITFGRYGEQEGRTLMPVSLLANHALVDGRHIAQFYEYFTAAAAALTGSGA